MNVFKIKSVTIQTKSLHIEPKEIYFVLRMDREYVSKVGELSGKKIFCDTGKIEGKIKSNQDIAIELWEYEPNTKFVI